MTQEKNLLSGIVHDIPDDMRDLLQTNDSITTFWNSLSPIMRNEWICWVTIVKKTETGTEHLHRMMEDLSNGKKRPCCWPGCPHRNEKAKKWFK